MLLELLGKYSKSQKTIAGASRLRIHTDVMSKDCTVSGSIDNSESCNSCLCAVPSAGVVNEKEKCLTGHEMVESRTAEDD